MKNYNKVNKQNEVYCFIVLFCPLFNFFNLLMTDFSLYHWFRNFNSVQRANRNAV